MGSTVSSPKLRWFYFMHTEETKKPLVNVRFILISVKICLISSYICISSEVTGKSHLIFCLLYSCLSAIVKNCQDVIASSK